MTEVRLKLHTDQYLDQSQAAIPGMNVTLHVESHVLIFTLTSSSRFKRTLFGYIIVF